MTQDPRPNLYPIKGGIGKCVAFTPLIRKLSARDGKHIAVAAGFPNVFALHPEVGGTVSTIEPATLTKVADKFDDIIYREPYISNYCKGDRHILDEWARMFGVEPFAQGGFNARPDLVLAPELEKKGEELGEKIQRRFIVVQWTGGQPAKNVAANAKYPDNYLIQGRNVRNYQDIMSVMAEAFPEHQFLVYALPNEPVEFPEHLHPRMLRAKAPALAYAALLRKADSFVALDSSLQHFGAATQVNKKGVVLWGQTTTPETIGYAFHENLNSTAQGHVEVPPKLVVDSLKKLVA